MAQSLTSMKLKTILKRHIQVVSDKFNITKTGPKGAVLKFISWKNFFFNNLKIFFLP